MFDDLPNCLEFSVPQMYTDHTHFTFAGREPDRIERNLNHDLSNISDWSVANKLTLNKSKTEFVVIGTRQWIRTLHRSPALALDNSPISQVTSTKSLRVHVDEHLSGNTHFTKISKKVASGIGVLKRCRLNLLVQFDNPATL